MKDLFFSQASQRINESSHTLVNEMASVATGVEENTREHGYRPRE